MARQIFVGMLCISLAGCEVNTSYQVNLIGLPKEDNYRIVRRDVFDLYLVTSPSTEAPGLTVIAYANDHPTQSWEWDEFQSWSSEKQDRVYSEYYDQVYFESSVRAPPSCPVILEKFDHRSDAQEMDYGMWLRSVSKRRFDEGSKGLFVEIPIETCAKAIESGANNSETLIVVVKNDIGEILDTINIAFGIEEYARSLDLLF